MSEYKDTKTEDTLKHENDYKYDDKNRYKDI